MSIVKCPICEKKFDKDKVPCTIYNARRYAHKECYPMGELYVPKQVSKVPKVQPELMEEESNEKDEELIKLEEYIKKLFKVDKISFLIEQQIKRYHDEYKFTYNGIAKSLKYFFEIKGNPTDKDNSHGIGIVPYIYDDSRNYYLNMLMRKNIMFETSKMLEQNRLRDKKEVVVINEPEVRKLKKSKFSFLDTDSIEEE